MDQYDIKRLALILAVQAEIDGMKAENKAAELNGFNPLPYRENHFIEKANDLRNLAYCHNEQL